MQNNELLFRIMHQQKHNYVQIKSFNNILDWEECVSTGILLKKKPCTMIIKKIIYNSNIFVHRFFPWRDKFKASVACLCEV